MKINVSACFSESASGCFSITETFLYVGVNLFLVNAILRYRLEKKRKPKVCKKNTNTNTIVFDADVNNTIGTILITWYPINFTCNLK